MKAAASTISVGVLELDLPETQGVAITILLALNRCRTTHGLFRPLDAHRGLE